MHLFETLRCRLLSLGADMRRREFLGVLGGAVALLPIFAKDILEVGPTGLGLLRASTPAGAFLAAPLPHSRESEGEGGGGSAGSRV